jgi:ribosome maturation protein SDO1
MIIILEKEIEMEIIQQCITAGEGDVTLGSELERRAQQKQEQQQDDNATNTLSTPSPLLNNSDKTLSDKLQSNLTIENSDDGDDDENQNNDSQTMATTSLNNNSRKAQKAAQKKSKKAKRREKEEHAERGDRIAAEKSRQRDRAERLGIVGDEFNTTPSLTAVSSEKNVIQGGEGVSRADVKPCNTCGGAFTPGEYRLHFRSDWHRYNVKLKMKNVPPVSEQEFLLCDSDAFFE